MGLTGLILSARLRLRPVETAFAKVDYLRTKNLDETLAALAAQDDRYAYSVAWLDGLARGAALGRGVLMRGNHAAKNELPAGAGEPLAFPRRTVLRVPFDFPACTLNRLSVGAFNALYYASHTAVVGTVCDLESFFYPLDRLADWNRLYGRRGFAQYQAVLPPETSAAGLSELLARAAAGRPFLVVLKGFGEANPGLLSFPCRGYTLAMDLPAGAALWPLLRELDSIVLRHRGRLYLAKDAALDPATFAAMYPRHDEFRALKARLDPRGLLASNLARRVGLTKGLAP
jgi:decaprenylphospho-beta-D-ribofuranose 2-oxidase